MMLWTGWKGEKPGELRLHADCAMNARKHQLTWFTAGCVIVALALVCSFRWFSHRGPIEPVYQGLRLSRWLDGSTMVRMSAVPTSPSRLAAAIAASKARAQVVQSVGPEALPWLLTEVEQAGRPGLRDVACRSYLRLWLASGFIRPWLPRPSGPPSETAFFNSLGLLGRLAPGTEYESSALRAIIAARLGSNTQFYKNKLRALGGFTNFPNEVIPILIAELNNGVYVETAVQALQNFGSSATPHLYPLALKETGQIRPAEYALEKVDEHAYSKLREEKEQLGIR